MTFLHPLSTSRSTYVFSQLSQAKNDLIKFLPTMPHDEVFDALRGVPKNAQNATKFFSCPNGHPVSFCFLIIFPQKKNNY